MVHVEICGVMVQLSDFFTVANGKYTLTYTDKALKVLETLPQTNKTVD